MLQHRTFLPVQTGTSSGRGAELRTVSLRFSALFHSANGAFPQVLAVVEETGKQRLQGAQRGVFGGPCWRPSCLVEDAGLELPLSSLQCWMELTPLLPGAVGGSRCLVLDWFKLGAPSLRCGSLGLVAPTLLLRLWLLVRCPGAELADGTEAVADHHLNGRELKSGAVGRIEFLI